MCLLDEVCGIHSKQQHHRRPLSGVCQPEGSATSGFYSGPSQLAHRLPYVCCLPGCGWGLQVYTGEHKGYITVVTFVFIVYINQELQHEIDEENEKSVG